MADRHRGNGTLSPEAQPFPSEAIQNFCDLHSLEVMINEPHGHPLVVTAAWVQKRGGPKLCYIWASESEEMQLVRIRGALGDFRIPP